MNEGKPPSYSILVDNLSASNVVVFDVETTGLDVKSDDIIQIAAVRLDAEGNHKEKFVRYLQASKSVGDSVEVHHITDEKLRQVGENPVTVLTQFLDFARDSVIVGHNVRYDLDILKNQLDFFFSTITNPGIIELKKRIEELQVTDPKSKELMIAIQEWQQHHYKFLLQLIENNQFPDKSYFLHNRM